MWRKLVLLAASCALGLLTMEGVLRLLVSPSDVSYGTFLGRELPPVAVIPDKPWQPESQRDVWHDRLIVQGRKITIGDLWGYHREDPLLGYVTRENSVSSNGWWQSNSIGARERTDTPRHVEPGKTRLLVFGDSYAQGTRVPQEEAWPEVLQASREALDVVNLGVDGYGMGQAFLRYRLIRETVDHDIVLLVFVPMRDLWRDINTLRTLAEDWDLHIVMPRFVLEQGQLELARSPYETAADVVEHNRHGLSPELEAHLERYDRFYFPAEHRTPRLLGRSVVHKVLSKAYFELKRRRLRDSRLELDSEALQVSTVIFRTMNEEVQHSGKRFVLFFLPSDRDFEQLARRGAYLQSWRRMVASICTDDLPCIDGADLFLGLPAREVDRGYDGTHFGPRTNAKIAGLVGDELVRLKLLRVDSGQSLDGGRLGIQE